jgi:hypothetical protein
LYLKNINLFVQKSLMLTKMEELPVW